MKKTLTLCLAVLIAAAPSFAKDKAPKSEKVKNVIFLIGDGMGLAATSAWLIDQKYAPTAFDRAQFSGLSKTYSRNNRVTDSAAGGTALATGTKTNNGMLGMLPDGTKLTNLTELAHKAKKSVGIVVSSNVLDATPAAFYAHAAHRGDYDVIADCMISAKPEVICGGGMQYFVNPDTGDRTYMDKALAAGYTLVETPEQFGKETKLPVLGLFSEGNYPMVIDRDSDYLADALNHTLDLLDDDKDGFFVMVEGSHIDHAEHANNSEQMIFEMEEFDKLMNAAFDYADTHKGTLVVITADHETGGVTLLPGSKDFTASDSGITVKFAYTSHTGIMVPVYSYGADAWMFSGIMENTDIPKKIREVLKLK